MDTLHLEIERHVSSDECANQITFDIVSRSFNLQCPDCVDIMNMSHLMLDRREVAQAHGARLTWVSIWKKPPPESHGVVDLDRHGVGILRGFSARASGKFVIEGGVLAAGSSPPWRAYRCCRR